MAHSKRCREKLSQYKIEGQSKPFIDRNLQLQLPGRDSPHNSTIPPICSPLYSHYVGSFPSVSQISSEINEAEFYRAMQEAEFAYEAWQQMQQQLQKAAQFNT